MTKGHQPAVAKPGPVKPLTQARRLAERMARERQLRLNFGPTPFTARK